ncbi:PrgI family protein, partial [Candidatus Peregrinibacteria bacterium]|nr:PrgI family protein [Candidatus Peregrinibacteria bacterium]
MQYKIPQNVGIEDKIVGPLSLRQLIIVAVGVGISWALFAILGKIYELNIIEYAIIALPGLVSIAFAMIRINDLPLSKYILLMLEFSMKPKRRMWDHRGIANLVAPDLWEPLKAETPGLNAAMLAKSKKAANLRQLSMVLDSGGFEHVKPVEHRDIDVAQDDNLVVEAYFGNDDREKMNMYWRTLESHKKRLSFFAKLPVTQLKAGTKEVETAKIEIAKAKAEAELARKAAVANQAPTPSQPRIQISTPSVTTPKPQAPQPTPQPKPSVPTPPARPIEKPSAIEGAPSAPLPPKQSNPGQTPSTSPPSPKALSKEAQIPTPQPSEKPKPIAPKAIQTPKAEPPTKPTAPTPPAPPATPQAGAPAKPQQPQGGNGKKQPPQPVRT